MLYIISYDIKDKDREETFIKKLESIGSVNQYLSNSWFLSTENNKDAVYKELKDLLHDSDLLLLNMTTLDNMSGWLPKNSVDWLMEHR
jgi:hypothetical protein